MAVDRQRRAWLLTINNPEEKGIDHRSIKETLAMNFPTLEYACMADEIGNKGKTPHIHVYFQCSSRVRFSKVKKHFAEAHIEDAKASAESNIEYIRKNGKWADTDKAETSIKGSFEEIGERPTQCGSNKSMERLYRWVRDGLSNAEILALDNDLILNIDKIDKLRTTLLIEEFKNTRRMNLKVIYISGATGTGKTRGVLDTHGDGNVYRVSDYQHPFDSYNCQSVIAFDEFRSSLRIADMLNYLDIYPLELPARYANKYACYEVAYIISNWSLEEQYKEVQVTNPESWKAFLRRIHEVRIYNADGSIDTYDSVESYFENSGKVYTPVAPATDELVFKLLKMES